jgi:hypothetical protein
VSDQSKPEKKSYGKPRFHRKTAVEVAALLSRHGLSSGRPDQSAQKVRLFDGPILLIEGYQGGLELLQQALHRAGLSPEPPLSHPTRSVVLRLPHRDHASSRQPSSVLLLDLRRAELEWPKPMEEFSQDTRWRRTPVAVLANSESQFRFYLRLDPERCWRLHRPRNSADVVTTLQYLLDLWGLADALQFSHSSG